MRAGREHGLGTGAVELHHGVDDGAHARVVAKPCAKRRVRDAGAERFGAEQRVARTRAGVAHDAVGACGAEHREAVLRLVVFDGVAAGQKRPGFAHLVRAAAQHLGHDVFSEAARKGEDVEGRERARAHREHVGERVGRGDGAELVGVVHHRREEVEREHGGGVVVEAVDGCVVGGLEAQQKLGRGRRRDALQYVGEVARTPLGRSTALLGQVRQPNALVLAHGCFPFRSQRAPPSIGAGAAIPWKYSMPGSMRLRRVAQGVSRMAIPPTGTCAVPPAGRPARMLPPRPPRSQPPLPWVRKSRKG